ncbi:MAG TPA: ACP S-malonyltransferase [Candidatus Fimousia stercorigallinarum]|nr:ACP S-malonyltransferase [Candidatus Fimousia stercorigallinarum]
MSKIAFLYPGQGSQTVGMGKDFYENSTLSKEIFDRASELLGFDVAALCFEKNDLLDRTDYTQAALVTTCIAMTKAIEEAGLTPDITAGLSLGEYCAIETAGGMDFDDAVKVIWRRGNLMHHAVPDGSGGMAAVLGLSGEQVKAVTDTRDDVTIANYNCPGQIVITGKKDGIEQLIPAIKEAGARRVMLLNVSGPFHSPYLKEAGETLADTLNDVQWHTLKIPYVTNVTAEKIEDISLSADLLKQQVYSSVLWEQSVRNMIRDGVDLFVEIGPGKTLSGFMKKIDKTVPVYRIGTWEQMEQVIDQIKELS